MEELKKEGFELDGIDEELFIQDVEGIDDGSVNWDYVNPETLFNTLNESGVLTNDYKYKVFCAFLEVRCFDDFEERVKSRGDHWDDDINIWSGYDWEDYGKEMLECCGYIIENPYDTQFIQRVNYSDNRLIDEDTGEILCDDLTEYDMQKFDGDVEEPQVLRIYRLYMPT